MDIERNHIGLWTISGMVAAIFILSDLDRGTFPFGTMLAVSLIGGLWWWKQNVGYYVTTKRLIHKKLFGEESVNLNLVTGLERKWALFGHRVIVKGGTGMEISRVDDAGRVISTIGDLLRDSPAKTRGGGAEAALKERLARGEITPEEYERTLSLIREAK